MRFDIDGGDAEPLKPFPPTMESDDKRKRYTIVYDGNWLPRYFRPGRWQKHLDKVIQELKEKSNKFLALDRTEVDDSALFPDIELARLCT